MNDVKIVQSQCDVIDQLIQGMYHNVRDDLYHEYLFNHGVI